jgi:hypothetical protein
MTSDAAWWPLKWHIASTANHLRAEVRLGSESIVVYTNNKTRYRVYVPGRIDAIHVTSLVEVRCLLLEYVTSGGSLPLDT